MATEARDKQRMNMAPLERAMNDDENAAGF